MNFSDFYPKGYADWVLDMYRAKRGPDKWEVWAIRYNAGYRGKDLNDFLRRWR